MRSHTTPIRRFRSHRTRYRPSRWDPSISEEYRVPIAQWLLRLLCNIRVDIDEWNADRIIRAVGLEQDKLKDLNHPKAIDAMRKRLVGLERQPRKQTGALYSNLTLLSDLIGLSYIEKELLAFAALLHVSRALADCLDGLRVSFATSVSEVLATAFEAEQHDLRFALRTEGVLSTAGLIYLDRTADTASDVLCLLDGLENSLLTEAEGEAHLFSEYFQASPPPRHPLTAFPHLKDEITILNRLFCGMQERPQGVNILLYGASGTGKTEFVRAFVEASGAQLFQIAHEVDDTRLNEKQFRFRCYQLAQILLARKTRCLVLFDEVEDVFPDEYIPLLGRAKGSGRYKAWTNTVLESNPTPAFWLCNEIQQIDPAFLRRFTYAIEFRTPPRAVRHAMLEQAFTNTAVRPAWIDQAAKNRYVTPALIEQVGKMVTLTRDEEATVLEDVAERMLRRNLEILGHPTEYLHRPRERSLAYRIDVLNPNQDLSVLTAGLRIRPNARLCLYGPPGTGKTAFAHHLAEQLDKPVLQKAASDILSCWVGETEKNLASMFKEAQHEGAVLFLDEADSFLQERVAAVRSWEVTKVNELLKQMEQFDGLFICATNLMERLDSAVLRRFDLKIRFGYLKAEQVTQLFFDVLTLIGSDDESPRQDETVICRLSKLQMLTPGDFSTIVRQSRALDIRYDSHRLLSALEAEAEAKMREGRSVRGFAR